MNFTHCKNNQVVPLVMVGVFLASAFLFISMAQAVEEAQIEAAIEDLNSATGQNITSEDQAKDLCNQEQYLDVCADIGKKHELYAPEELKQVDSFLSEVKGKILDDIKSCADEECLVRVASELATKIKTKNPTLATDFNLTTTIVAEKKAVVQAAKEVGVNFGDCESMDPDTAPVDLLRKCARLAKDVRVQKYIPEEKRALVNQFDDRTINLREALSVGKYQCGDGTLEGCGNYCLNPGAATRAAGIPAVCTQIAKEVFGQEGVKQLETSYQQVGQVKDYYSKKFVLTLPDGSELVGENQIKNACDKAFSGRLNNIDGGELAKACGNFAVKNGFVSQAEVDRGLKLLESFNQKGQNTDFNKCIADPAACRDFIPEDDRNRFDAGNQIFALMKSEIGFDPSQCERGSVDQAIGTKCFEGSKRALAKIESLGLATQSEEAKFIVEDIKRHVAQGEEFMNKKDEFNQVFSQQGGPGGCRSEAECFTYCSNPTNGPECISFGAKQQISGFRGEEAVQKFQEYNQNLQRPGLTSNEYTGQYQQFPAQSPYPRFQPPGQGGYVPPGQIPGFNQPGPGFGPPPGIGGFYPGPAGPSPECFAAIQSGDFVKAKMLCSSPTLSIPLPETPICPASFYVECPAGQYRESFRNENGCWIDGPCKPAPTYSPGPYPTGPYPSFGEYKGDANSCPGFAHSKWDQNGKRYCRLNETNSCQYNYPSYLDRANYVPSDCPTEYGGPYPTYSSYPTGSVPSCPSGQWWDWANNRCTSSSSCGYGSYWDPASQSCKPSGGTYSPSPTYTGGTYCSQSLINLLGTGCHQMYSDSSGRQVYCDGSMSKSAKEGDTSTTAGCAGGYQPYPSGSPGGSYAPPSPCPSGQWWDYSRNACMSSTSTYSPYPTYTPSTQCNYNNFCDQGEDGAYCKDCAGTPYPNPSGSCPSGYHYHGESGGFCMNDQENYGGTCYNSAGTSKITCPQPTYSPYPSPSGTPTSSGSCPSGSYTVYVNNAGGYCMSNTDSTKCGPLNSTSVSSFGSCSSYQGSTTYSPAPTYSSGPGGVSCYSYSSESTCKTSGCTWYLNHYDGTHCDDAAHGQSGIQPSYSTSPGASYTPYPSCPSGQWWDYARSSCVSTSTSYSPYPTASGYTYTPAPSCPSGQWWDYATSSCKSSTATYSPPPGGSYTPYPTSTTYTYTPYPTYSSVPPPTYSYSPPPSSYTPPPSCPSGQWWDGSTNSCQGSYTPPPTTYTPYPTTEYTPPPSTYSPPPTYEATPPPYSPPPASSEPPPPTSSLYPHYIVTHCQQLGRTWDGSKCQANGLFARFYENNFANILRFFYIVP